MAPIAFITNIKESIKRVLLKRPLISSAVLGMLFTLGFAPFFLWPLALLALCVLVVLVQTAPTVKRAFRLGLTFAFFHHVTALYWLAKSFYISFGDWSVALALGIPAVIITALYLGLYIAMACGFYKKGLSLFRVAQAPLLFAVLFVGLEFARSYLPQVFPWNLTGYMWTNNLYLIQFASAGGVFGLSFVFVFAAALLAGRKHQRVFAPFVILFLAVWGFVRLEYGEGSKVVDEGIKPTASFLLSQPDIDQQRKWREDRLSALEWLVGHTGAARKDMAESIPVVSVWPETAVTYELEGRESIRKEITQFMGLSDILLTGGLHIENDPDSGMKFARNGLYALNANGGVTDSYYKEYLIPWGEYFPLINYFPSYVRDLWGGRLDFRSAAIDEEGLPRNVDSLIEIPMLDGDNEVHNLRLLPLICGEAVLPFLAGNRYAEHGLNADALVVVTNDAWFDGTIGPYQHYAMARLRAVELKLPMIRVANTGISAVIDAYGREVKRINMKQRGVLKWDMH